MNVVELKLSQITHRTENHRLKDNEQDVAELMASIKKAGLINPITVKKKGKKYTLIAGFRRMLACTKLKMEEIPCHVTDTELSDTAINLVENLQRENTSSYEVGRGIHRMMTTDKLSNNEVGVLLGISPFVVKTFLHLFKETPAKYRNKVVSIQKGKCKKGMIPNTVASEIINMQKAGKINAKKRNDLFEKAIKGITIGELRAISKGAVTENQETTTISVTLQVTPAHKKKLGLGIHKKIRALVEKEFQVKVLNK